MVNQNQDTTPEDEAAPAPPTESRDFRTDAPSQRRIEQIVQPEPVPADGEEGGAAEVTAKVNESLEKGYIGIVPDPTPNENYTVQGVTSGAPRPDAQEEPLSPGETS